jgi:hypothetical protein
LTARLFFTGVASLVATAALLGSALQPAAIAARVRTPRAANRRPPLRAASRLGIVPVLVALVLVGATASPAGAQTPVGPYQHFVGLVNGSNDHPVVYTACAGPVRPGQKGPVVGGELSVAEVAGGSGYTGPLRTIYAWFVPASSSVRPPSLSFTEYGRTKAIPTSRRWWVPCDGTGTVEFSSCPYLAPCVFGWVPDYVTVTFENIAV